MVAIKGVESASADIKNKKYHIKTGKDIMTFTTLFFRAEKESVLHKGIYTQEFASMLLASALCVFAYFLIYISGIEIKLMHLFLIVLLFIITFFISNKFVFSEKYLEVVFDKNNKTAVIIHHGFIRKKREEIPLKNIKSVEIGSKKFIPENIDGIKLVEKISLQHGTIVPDLGKEEEFVILSLRLTDGSERTLLAAKIEEEPEMPMKEIENFLEI